MSSRLLKVSQQAYGFSNLQSTRSVIRMLGLPPEKGRSLKKKIEDYNRVDPEVARKVDIGLPSPHGNARTLALERSKILSKVKNDPQMERLARELKLDVPLESIEEAWKESGLASSHLKVIAEHYNIYSHLFGDAFFYPRVMLDIEYVQKDDSVVPVYRGNIIKPREALIAPEVKFNADKDSLWTLILTNPDGHLSEENAEYVHWFIGNIPGNQVSKGEVVFDYIPPFPPAGTGFHRLVFVLYKQNGKIDYSSLKRTLPCTDLSQRTFKTIDFYRERQDNITPAGLGFYQTDYDYSVKKVFNETLGMKEPRFEYDFPEPYIAEQKWFPNKVAFNVYLDRYRDPCEINKEYIVDRLKTTDPFLKNKPKLNYPGAQYFGRNTPSWLKRKLYWDSMGWGRINNSK
ncbi:39S ribosomal protein L38, mitochondrial [Thrips palmi]|uniref:Large ribosomal subunit protein mL38 n=1 Tax=Thrips palmi TaxID=161013 RepID=A0A6P9ABL1_THRPL|nr:39S ribosomal protein L38, mitochondrial [Thrips palmi]